MNVFVSEVHRPFLETILDNPDDLGARLVWADFLEETGDDDALAEFIRLGCHMSWQKLSRNEDVERFHELLLHNPHWLSHLDGSLRAAGSPIFFKNGSHLSLHCSVSDFLMHGQAVVDTFHLQRIWLETSPGNLICEIEKLSYSDGWATFFEFDVLNPFRKTMVAYFRDRKHLKLLLLKIIHQLCDATGRLPASRRRARHCIESHIADRLQNMLKEMVKVEVPILEE